MPIILHGRNLITERFTTKIMNFFHGRWCEVDPERVGREAEGGRGDGTCSILTDLSSLHLLCTGARLHGMGGGGG